MKTKGNNFPDIWEKDGIAPFNSRFIDTNLLNLQLPTKAIGVYSGYQGSKNISLLAITNVQQNSDNYNDIQISFRFLKKIEINSQDFDQEISKICRRIFFSLEDEILNNILKKFGFVYTSQKQEGLKYTVNEVSPSASSYITHYLNNYFHNIDNWIDFEKKSAILFHIIGFQVLFEGHKKPQKRVADFYCYTPPSIKENRICIIVDCKNQDGYFISAADERAMREYIEDKKTIISQEGISSKNIQFLFVARSFAKEAKIKVLEIAQSTQSYGALISYKNLTYLAEKKIRMGYKFYLERFKKLFKNDEILPSNINYIYSMDNEFRI
jgi:hypothetical protein